jgi:VCBS repeat-containing protein
VWTVVTEPLHGDVTVNADGTYTYTPDLNYNGPDSFTYKVCDTDGDCSTATVTLTILPVGDTPVAVNDNTTTNEDTAVTIPVLTNDSFGGDGPCTMCAITITIPPTNGIATVNNGGTPNDPTDDQIVYTPNANFNGSDNLTYQICDYDNDCVTAVVTINVNPVDDLPVAVTDSNTTTEDTPVNGNLAANDTEW